MQVLQIWYCPRFLMFSFLYRQHPLSFKPFTIVLKLNFMKKFLFNSVLAFISIAAVQGQGVSKMFGLIGGYPQSDHSSNGFLFSTDSSGQNFQPQYNFPVTVSGAYPTNLELVSYNGKFYGTTYSGGTGDFGTIFEYDPATNIYTKKIDFGPNYNLNGGGPRGSLLLYNGKFYGLASSYGANFGGTIFEWDPATNVFTKRYDFPNNSSPQNSLRLLNGKMYGTCQSAGSNSLGFVFEWDPATNSFTDLLDMTGPGAGSGWGLNGNVTVYNNKLYCMSQRGAANDAGALYIIDPTLPIGSNTTIVVAFNSSNGANGSNNEMIVYNNKLYGCTYYGGTNGAGVLFELDPSTNIYTKLYDFNYYSAGSNPLGKLVLNGTKFLGFCSVGGTNGTGTIYEWDPANPTTAAKKYEFGLNNNDNPINPGSTMAVYNSKFYAVTYNGGFNNQGTLLEYDYAAGTVTKKLNFNTPENGRIPYGRPTLLNGKIYGTCNTGPQPDGGAIWQYDPSTSIYSRKFNFDMTPSSGSGNRPNSSPVAYNGKLYGTTPSGGLAGFGVFYEFDPETNIYVKQDFQTIGGAFPIGEPTLYNNKFYGMTNAAGLGNNGIIYSYDPATGTLAKLYDVQNSGGNTPGGGFTVYNNKLYGSTSGGGANFIGTIIMYDPATNTASTVFSLNGGGTGQSIQNVMTLYNNKLYGNTFSGGPGGRGVIFEFDPATNNYTVLYNYITNTGANGYDATGPLTLNGNKMYTITRDAANVLVIQLDLATNTVTTRSTYTPASNINIPGYHNGLTVVPAFIANGTPGSCESYPVVNINATNNNQWVPILNNAGDVVAEIKANGNNLGDVSASTFINNGTVREDAAKQLYMDRNITIGVQVQPATPVNIRLYVKTSEYLALKNATNSIGQPSGITSINDIGIYKNSQSCASALGSNQTTKLVTTASDYEYGYVLSATVGSFSTFFFAKASFTALPISLIKFDAVKNNAQVQINWVTANEQTIQRYEVEKSTDGINFSKLTEASPKYSSSNNDYKTIDASPLMGLNFYRLKMIDKEGKFTYSNIVKISFDKKTSISIAPNPAHDYLIINGANSFNKLEIVDVNGRVVKVMNANSTNRYSIAGLTHGMYFIRLVGANETEINKIVVE
jgi:uncharacterized repeat protein (TIGR03803 family)